MATAHSGQPVFNEEKLHTISDEVVLFDSTRDGTLAFWLEKAAGGLVPVINGERLAGFDELWVHSTSGDIQRLVGTPDPYMFSRDGCHFAYVGRRGASFFVAKDGVESRGYEAVHGELEFGPIGTLAYTASVDGTTRLVLDGEIQSEYEAVPGQFPSFSADESHVAFIGRVAEGQAVIRDGIAGPTFEDISPYAPDLKVSSNGRVSYSAKLRTDTPRYVFVVDTDVVAESTSQFYGTGSSPDGSRFHWGDYESRRMFVDGAMLPEGAREVTFSPDGRLYMEVGGVAFLDDAPIGRAGWHGPVFSADGRHWAWSAKVEGGRRKWWQKHKERHLLIRDGKPASEEMDFVGIPRFSPDGEHLAVDVTAGKTTRVVVDGITGPAIDWLQPGTMHFSEDGLHVAYVALVGKKSFLVVDGELGPPIDHLRAPPILWPAPREFQFSSDGHVGAVALVEEKVGVFVESGMRPFVDQTLGPELGACGQPIFDGDGSVDFFGLRGWDVLRVRATLD